MCVCVCVSATERRREVGGHVSEGHKSAVHVLGQPRRPGEHIQTRKKHVAQVSRTHGMLQYDVSASAIPVGPVHRPVMFLTCVSDG